MIKFIRIIKAGFLNFKRSGTISWAAVLVMTITLSVITSIILLQAALNFSLNSIKEKVDVTIYLTVSATESKAMSLKNSLLGLPEVESVEYTTADEALSAFRARHVGDYPTIAALDEIGSNPLGAYLNVKAKNVSQYESIASFLNSDSFQSGELARAIDKVNYHENKLVINRLNSLIDGANKLGFLLTLILIIISIIITFNTIRLAIFISREEIGIMRLVGASKTTVRGPFMVEGVIYGIVSTLVTIIIFFPITAWFGRSMTEFLGLSMNDYYLSNILQIFVILLLSGSVLGVISSFLATTKYLKR